MRHNGNILFIFALLGLVLNMVWFQHANTQKVISQHSKKYPAAVTSALENAGKNRSDLEKAIKQCPENQFKGLNYLLENMPERDLTSLSSDFILNNVKLAYSVMDSVKWGSAIPNDIFLNYVLPYVNLHERRDDWRADFYEKFYPLVKELSTPGEAAVKLNKEIWDIVNVFYNTKRPKADQSPYESIEAGMASCTGLSILLIDACRAVGVPARFVGVPLWVDHSGNHSWVEIWDNGWHFIGAGEPGPLDKTWFADRAALANDDNWKYSIYAATFKKTDVVFPPLFDSTATYVYGDIVTDRYSKTVVDDGKINLAIRLFDRAEGSRIVGKVIVEKNGEIISQGETRDEMRDYNDFFVVKLLPNESFQIACLSAGKSKQTVYTTTASEYQFFEIYLEGL